MGTRLVPAWGIVLSVSACTHSSLDLDRPAEGHRKPVTISAGMVVGSAAIASFPVLVRSAADADLREEAAGGGVAFANGADLRFELEGVELPREIEQYDAATGALTAWVLVPSLAPGAGQVLDLRYGGVVSPLAPTLVWQDYVAVWHLAEDPSLLVVSDSSPTATHGTASGFAPGASVAGIAGRAIDFAGAQHLRFGDAAALDVGVETFSWSVSVLSAPTTGEYDMPFFNGGSSSGSQGFDLEFGENNWNGCVSDGAAVECGTIGQEVDLVGAWHRVEFVVDRGAGTLRGHLDGAPVSSRAIATLGSITSSTDTTIGGSNDANFGFHGRIDEVRVSLLDFGPGRIATEAAMIGTAGHVVVGPQDSP